MQRCPSKDAEYGLKDGAAARGHASGSSPSAANERSSQVPPAATVADCGGQFAEFSLLEEDAVHTLPQEAAGLGIAQAVTTSTRPA